MLGGPPRSWEGPRAAHRAYPTTEAVEIARAVMPGSHRGSAAGYDGGMKPKHPLLRARAFSLVEALFAASLIALLASLLLAGVQAARDASRSVRCLASLREIGMAGIVYAGDNRGFHCPTQGYLDGHFGGPDLNETQYWTQYLAPYAADGNAGMYGHPPDLGVRDFKGTVFKGCPSAAARFAPWNYDLSNTPWRFGYGMNPSKTIVSARQVDGFDDFYRPPQAMTMVPYPTSLFGWRFFRAVEVTHPGSRVWVGDSVIDNLACEKAGVRSYSVGAAEDYPHWTLIPWAALRLKDHLALADPLRHRSRANYVFFDGHAQSLEPTAFARAFCEPDR